MMVVGVLMMVEGDVDDGGDGGVDDGGGGR